MNGDPADLSNLRDIVLPPAVSWWPPAYGWWVIGAGLLAAGLVGSIHAYKRHEANAYRREAIRELDTLSDVTGIMPLLKRAAMVAYGREAVAPLTGLALLAFLDHTGGTAAFTTGPARLLPGIAFGQSTRLTTEDSAMAVSDARRWLRTHRAPEA